MRCPVCGADLTFDIRPADGLDITTEWPVEQDLEHEPLQFSDWVMTETGLHKLLMEYEKAKAYMDLA